MGKPVNKYVQQKLNELEFICEECPQIIKYEKRKKHWKYCGPEFDVDQYSPVRGISGSPERNYQIIPGSFDN